jgi:hypothetical protein
MCSKLTVVRRALAFLISTAMLAALAPGLEAPLSGEHSVHRQGALPMPSEPRDPECEKLTSAILLSDVETLPLFSSDVVSALAEDIGPGDLHPPVIERPPIVPSVPT